MVIMFTRGGGGGGGSPKNQKVKGFPLCLKSECLLGFCIRFLESKVKGFPLCFGVSGYL